MSASVQKMLRAHADGDMPPVLKTSGLVKNFPVAQRKRGRDGVSGRRDRRPMVHAVDHLSVELRPGRTTALVGESGSGKSTVARLLAGLYTPTAGEIHLDGRLVHPSRHRKRYSSVVQMIFQDPFASLNEIHTVRYQLTRPLKNYRRVEHARLGQELDQLLDTVKLTPSHQYLSKHPHELSGGQRQRVAIARALAADPQVLLADEPVSMLDVSLRVGILNLLDELQRERQLAMLYITHDIASARYFADEIAVMYAGSIVEQGSAEEVTQRPRHPYTQLLIASAPEPSRTEAKPAISHHFEPPNLIDRPPGCPFAPRCAYAMDICSSTTPPVVRVASDHWTRCHLPAAPARTGADAQPPSPAGVDQYSSSPPQTSNGKTPVSEPGHPVQQNERTRSDESSR